MKTRKVDYKPEMTYESLLSLFLNELPECTSIREYEGTKKEFIGIKKSNYVACWVYPCSKNQYLCVGAAIYGSAQFLMRVWPFFFISSRRAQKDLISKIVNTIERKYAATYSTK